MSEEQSEYLDAKTVYEVAVIHVEYMGDVVARLRPKKIFVYAPNSGEIVNDGRQVYKKANGKWYWEINP
ncbi:hypothetical protein L0244_40110 [bacterium]|nr:hypothetical protein [bacterium]